MRSLVWLAWLGTLTGASARADEPDVVAVLMIEHQGVRISTLKQRHLSEYIATLVAESGRHVVPTDAVRRLLEREKASSYRACVDERCQIEIGKELAASQILSSSITRIGGRCVVSMRLYDLRTAATVSAATSKGGCREAAIVELVETAVVRLTGVERRAPIGPVLAARALSVPPAPSPRRRTVRRAPRPVERPALPALEPSLVEREASARWRPEDRIAAQLLTRKLATKFDARTTFALAMLYTRDATVGSRRSGIDLFKRLLERAPDYARSDEALLELGRLYVRHGASAKAIAAWRRLIRRHPKSRFFGATHDALGRARYREAWATYRTGDARTAAAGLAAVTHDALIDPDVRRAASADRRMICTKTAACAP